MKMSKRMKPWFIIVAIAILIVSVAVPVGAENSNRKLYGDYSANFTLNCGTCSAIFNTTSPFSPTVPACLPPAKSTTYTWNAQGVYTFNGKGDVEFTGRYIAVGREPIFGVIPVVLPPLLKCTDGTYTVDKNRTFVIRFGSCNVYGDELETIKVHEILNVNLKGQLLDRMDGPILLLTDTMNPDFPNLPNIEQVNSDPPFPPTIYRICGLTGTAIPIKGLLRKKSE